MKKRVIITLSIIVFIAVGTNFFLSYSNKTNSDNVEELEEDSFFKVPPLEDENISELASLEKLDLNLSNEKIEIQKIDETPIMNKNIYTEIDKDELLKSLPIKRKVQPRFAIQLTQGSIHKLNVGDTITLPNVGQVEYEATISKKIVHDNGSVSVTGNINGESSYAVVLTEGKKNSYATINTPEGSFEIETINGQGYIYSVEDLENRLIDPNKDDFIAPNKEEH